MVAFTIIKGIIGLLLIFGLFTRLMSIGVFLLAMGILLGSGWLATTCLDEWQIGLIGIASGLTLFLSGSSYYLLDYDFIKKNHKFVDTKWFK
jgi:thiosulfate dehydrogenase [quinone] large subunit